MPSLGGSGRAGGDDPSGGASRGNGGLGGGDSNGHESISAPSRGYSMHDQTMAGLSGAQAVELGREGVSSAADAAAEGAEGYGGGYIYGIRRDGTYGLLGKPSLSGHGVMTTAGGWGYSGFGGMNGMVSIGDPRHASYGAYVEVRRDMLAKAQAAYKELGMPFHEQVAAANLPASYRDQLISAFQKNPSDESIPSEFTAGVNMAAMEDSLKTMNGAIGDLVNIGLLGPGSLTTPETAFAELHSNGLTSYNAETGQMELSNTGMAGEFAENFSGQVLGFGLTAASSFLGGIYGIVADIMAGLAMKPGQGTITGFGNMVDTYTNAQITGLDAPTGTATQQGVGSKSGASPVSVPQVAIQTGYTPAPSNYAAATPKAATGVYGFGAPKAMAIDLNYGQDHGRYI